MDNKDKERLEISIKEQISIVEGYFRDFDSIQLLGSVGLYLIDNLPNMEKYFMAHIAGGEMQLDEDAEVIAEYAMNFGLSMANCGGEMPSSEVVISLRETLRGLCNAYKIIDMPLEYDAEKYIDWVIHSQSIAVRGDGYQQHVQEVFQELFYPHSGFYELTYGFSMVELFNFFMDLEDRIICKIGDQRMIYGATKLHERWKRWEEKTFGPLDDEASFLTHDFSKGMFGEFFEANPDVPHSDDGNMFLPFAPDDYSGSEKIFWVWPQNDTERNIMEALSTTFGSNASFIAEGEYKGNIMNGYSIYEKPFVKVNDMFYCFTPMIPHRNLFYIAERLMMRDDAYYQKNFQQNLNSYSRDKYIERKVKEVMESFLPTISFHSSLNYTIEEGISKRTELDILGVSDSATYVIEVKAHELNYRDKAGLKGAKYKFEHSVAEACRQCCRAKDYICNTEAPIFSEHGGDIVNVDKVKPVFKIAVSLQHYSSLIGQMDMLIEAGLMENRYRDTWIVSLFDLMACAPFIKSEDDFINYLEMHNGLSLNHCIYYDELDVLNGFLNSNMVDLVKSGKQLTVAPDHKVIDEYFVKEFYPTFVNINKEENENR